MSTNIALYVLSLYILITITTTTIYSKKSTVTSSGIILISNLEQMIGTDYMKHSQWFYSYCFEYVIPYTMD